MNATTQTAPATRRNHPAWVIDILEPHFTAEELDFIDAEWFATVEIRFSEASKADFLQAARLVLTFKE